MVIDLPAGRLELTPRQSSDLVIVAVPENFDGRQNLTMFPPDTHVVFTPNSATREFHAMLARYRRFLMKHAATSSQAQRLLATIAFISETDPLEYSDVEEMLADAGSAPVPNLPAMVGHLVRRGLCRRAGRGLFALTDAGRTALDLPKRSPRASRKQTSAGRRRRAAATT